MDIESKTISKRVFEFKKCKNWTNRIANKKLNTLTLDEVNNTIECKDSQSEPTISRAQNPLNTQNCLSYFQVQILQVTEEDSINVGLMSKDSNTKQFVGKNTNSFGYLKGDLYLNKKKVSLISLNQKLKVSDRIGIGINCHKKTFMVIKNGVIIQSGINIPFGWSQFFPAVGLSNQGQKIKFYFSISDFKFKIQDQMAKIQREIETQIAKQEISNRQIYSLVHQYLSFNQYNDTLDLLNSKNLQFKKLSKLTKNPSIITPNINLEKQQEKQAEIKDEEMNEPLRIRERIMSERIEAENEEIQYRRKNTEMVLQERASRKLSLVSNRSGASNRPNFSYSDNFQSKQVEKQQMFLEQLENQMVQESQNQNEKFLLNLRFEIVQLIKEKKIEESMELIKISIPKILQYDHLLPYFKSHIFFKKIKQQSSISALIFTNNQKQIFQNNQSIPFPFYNSITNNIEWKILKNIYQAFEYNANLSSKKSQSCIDMISDKQFQSFSVYVNEAILKNLGYLGCSRLTYYINSMKKINEKLKDYKGMACGIELKL